MSEAIPPTDRLHHADTHLLNFEAHVLAVRRRAEGGWEVALDRSAFYVESGGQPRDRGTIGGREVLGLSLENGVVWHAVGFEPGGQGGESGGEGGRAVLPSPEPGAVVTGEIDRPTRIDHMQQHTGQHILSQSFVRAGQRGTRGFHLGTSESTIDLDGARPDEAVVAQALEIANGCVCEDRPVRILNVTAEELGRYPLRRDPGVARDVQRVVEIDGFDWSTCGGTHARRTGEVGPIHILGVEKSKAFWRVRFLAGWRTLRYLEAAHQILSEVARAHSVRWDAIPEAVRRWREEASGALRELRRLRVERGEGEADRLHAATASSEDGARRLTYWSEEAGSEELRALAGRLVSLGPVLLLAGGREQEQRVWVAARSQTLPGDASNWDAAAELKRWLAPLSGRGGGNSLFAFGTSPSSEPAEEVRRRLGRWFGDR